MPNGEPCEEYKEEMRKLIDQVKHDEEVCDVMEEEIRFGKNKGHA